VSIVRVAFVLRTEVEDVRRDLGRDRLHPLREWGHRFGSRTDLARGLSRDLGCALVVRVLARNVGQDIDLRA
jgi:hypothetical protein